MADDDDVLTSLSSAPEALPTDLQGFATGAYPEWREKRIAKLTEILGGPEWFAGKNILELACGAGHVGKALIELGAHVTFGEGRAAYVDHLTSDGYDAHVVDQDTLWALNRQFDLIIHWGVLYHLTNWEQDLKCALDHTQLMCLESQVTDQEKPDFFLAKDEKPYESFDTALNGLGNWVSPEHIEKVLSELGTTFTRYDDGALNVWWHAYDWEGGTRLKQIDGVRRFWLVKRAPAT